MNLFLLFLFPIFANAAPPTLNMDDAFAELDDKLVLHFLDAKTGNPVSGGSITFQGKIAVTDSQGSATFVFPEVDVDETIIHASFSKHGYVSCQLPISFLAGALWINRFSVTEELAIDELRIVLDWMDKPKDLDAHWSQKNGYHISYRNKKNQDAVATLDRDDQDGNGPETITIKKLDHNQNYEYFVHDYSNHNNLESKALSNSHAHVVVYSNQGVEQYYRIPEEQIGNFWKVFTFKNGTIVDTNVIHNTKK
jgi:hypothetical protein